MGTVRFFEKFLVLVFILLGMCIFVLLALVSDSGLDITDESYYLLNAQQPANVAAGLSSFGYYTGVLYHLAGESIGGFRLLGLLTLVLVSIVLAHLIWKQVESVRGTTKNRHIYPVLLSLAAISSPVYYAPWLLTPSYNWLALLAVLICTIGLLGANLNSENSDAHRNRLGLYFFAFLVGFGGALAFLSKPTTGASLAAITLLWAFLSKTRNKWLQFLGTAGVSAFLIMLIHILVVENGISNYAIYLLQGLELGSLLGGGHRIPDLVIGVIQDFKAIPKTALDIAPFSVKLIALLSMSLVFHKVSIIKAIQPYFFTMSVFLTWFELFLGGAWNASIHGQSLTVLFLLPAIVVTGLIIVHAFSGNGVDKNVLRKFVGLIAVMFAGSFAYAFGTVNGVMRQMSGSFVLFALAYMLIGFFARTVLGQKLAEWIVASMISLCAALTLMHGYEHPYRLPQSISSQTQQVQMLGSAHSIRVDSATENYVENLQKLAVVAGWQPNMYLIDLTGGSPGASVILSAQYVGVPWLLGAYPGSEQFVNFALSLAPKVDLENSWILSAPEGVLQIPDNVLQNLGLSYPQNYVAVGEVVTGYRNETQILWRPRH